MTTLTQSARDRAYVEVSTVGMACEECGSPNEVERHHDDYAKPLEVRILCKSCHRAWHTANGQGINRFGQTPVVLRETRRVFCVQCQEWRDSISPLNLASGKSFCCLRCYDLYFSAAERAKRKARGAA